MFSKNPKEGVFEVPKEQRAVVALHGSVIHSTFLWKRVVSELPKTGYSTEGGLSQTALARRLDNFFSHILFRTTLTARSVWVLVLALCCLLSFGSSFAETAPQPGDNPSTTQTTYPFSEPVLTPAEQRWLREHPVIRLSVDSHYAPYSEIDANGHFFGEAADYIHILSRQLGIKFKIVHPKTWSDVLEAVRQHKTDMAATVVALPERRKYLAFTKVYINTPLVVMTRSDDFSLRSPKALAHRVVALVKGYSSTRQILAEYPDIKPLLVSTPLQGLIAVATGEADAYVGALGVNLAIARQYGIANLRIAAAYKLHNGQRFAVRDDWAILARILDKALDAIPATTKAKIQYKWVPQQIPENHSGLPVLTPDERRWIAKHQQIRVGLAESDEPDEYFSKADMPEGFAAEYLNLLSAKTGLNFKMVPLKNTANLSSQLDSGLLDMVVVHASPTHISDKHRLSVPFRIAAIGIFARRNAGFIGSLSDLKGKRVALTPGLVHQAMLRRQTGLILLSEPNPKAVLQAVQNGKADAGLLEVDAGQYLLEKYGFKTLRMVHVITGDRTSLRFMVRPDNAELLGIVNKVLVTTTDQEAATIRRRVLNVTHQWGVPVETVIVWSLLIFAGGLLLFLLQTMRSNKRLNEEVERRRLADSAAARSEQRFHNFFVLAHTGMAITSPEKGWLNVNPRLCEMLGYTKEELERMTWVEITHPDDLDADMAQFSRLISGEIDHYSMEKRFIRKSGDSVYTYLTVSCLRRPDRSVDYVLATLEDITKRKLMETALLESEERYRKTFETILDAIVITRLRDGKYIDVNKGFERLSGFSREEALGKTSIELNIWRDPADRQRLFEKIKQNGICRQLEADFNNKNGHFFNGLMSASHIKINDEDCIISITRDITEQKKAERAIRVSKRRLAKAEQVAHIGNWNYEVATGAITWSDELWRIFGREPGAVALNYDTLLSWIRPDFRAFHDEYMARMLKLKPGESLEDLSYCLVRPNGEERWVEVKVETTFANNGQPLSFFGIVQDITQDKQAREEIDYQNSMLKTQQEASLDAILVVGANREIISYNHQFIDLWQLTEAALAKRQESLILKMAQDKVEEPAAFSARVEYLYEHSEEKSREEIRLKDGRIIDRYSAPIMGANGEYSGRVWYFRDITEQKEAVERISYLANFDALTGLPNRVQLAEHIRYALSLAKRRNEQFAVMFVDIDLFKNINDTFGHNVGDSLIVMVARRLQSILRAEDTVARLGGDEFILMLPECDTQGAAQVAQKILHTVSEPCQIEQFDLAVTASIGIALYPDDGLEMDALFKSADNAMYRAKQGGRNDYRFFTAEMHASAARTMQLLNALRQALAQDQFHLHYQPQVSIEDGRVLGAEALLRWTHPELGNISPAEFIPIAEDNGLILSIGEWTLRTSATQVKQWIDEGHPAIVIAVNLSAVQFRHNSLPELVSSILDDVGLPPEYLELELTERVAANDPLRAIEVMNDLHERGVRMSIDDFGTGYSSLSYLKKFKVYKLKIDQSFVRDIHTDAGDRAIVTAIIGMAKSLGLKSIAEGVETAEQLAFLREEGCDEVQGYFFSKPLSAEQFAAFITGRKA